MNIRNFCLLNLFAFAAIANCQNKELNVYQQELKDFKNSEHELIFDEDADPCLRSIQADIENFKELSFFQRLARFAIMFMDVIVVTPKTMPKLYAYVDGICKQHGIPTPTICISTEKGILNACALKLFTSTGAILIWQKMLKETSVDELEAIIAHEIGHIKHNHVNKILAVTLASYLGAEIGIELLTRYAKTDNKDAIKSIVPFLSMLILPKILINKRFEMQADEFAYKNMNKGQGIVEFFETLIEKEKKKDSDFANTYDLLQENKSQVSTLDYFTLITRYYLAKTGHLVNKGMRWIYHKTPLGAHPSPELRIKAAQDYINQTGLQVAN